MSVQIIPCDYKTVMYTFKQRKIVLKEWTKTNSNHKIAVLLFKNKNILFEGIIAMFYSSHLSLDHSISKDWISTNQL